MVKIICCDRCDNEIKRTEKWQDRGFEEFDDIFENNNNLFSRNGMKKATKVQLCSLCLEGYNKIIDDTNYKIKSYLNEGKTERQMKLKLGNLIRINRINQKRERVGLDSYFFFNFRN